MDYQKLLFVMQLREMAVRLKQGRIADFAQSVTDEPDREEKVAAFAETLWADDFLEEAYNMIMATAAKVDSIEAAHRPAASSNFDPGSMASEAD
jgi:hypothetical protein